METDDFYLTKWKGLDNWQCKHCPFATVGGLGEMLAHLVNHRSDIEVAEVVVNPATDEEE